MKRFTFLCLVAGFLSVLVLPRATAQETYLPVSEVLAVSHGDVCGPACGEPVCEEPKCGPRWTIYGGVLYMKLERPDNQVLFGPFLNASDFRYDYEPGFEVGAIAPLGCKWDIEARFMDQENWEATRAVSVTIPGVADGLARLNIAGRYETNLRSAELIVSRRICDWLRIGAGFRWLQLNENLGITIGTVPPILTATAAFSTRNDLYGGEVSADARLWSRGRFSLQAIGKAGVYSVNARAAATLVGGGGGGVAQAARETDIAFVGEAGLNGLFRITDHVSLRAGYQVLWVEGVALASDQINSLPTINTRGGIFAHGAVAGLEIRW